jgi:hypothetical protein
MTFRLMERRRENPATNFLEDDAVGDCFAQEAVIPPGVLRCKAIIFSLAQPVSPWT